MSTANQSINQRLNDELNTALNAYESCLQSSDYSEQRAKPLKATVDRLREQIAARAAFHGDEVPQYDRRAFQPADQRERIDFQEKRAFDLFLRKGIDAVQSDRVLRTYAPLASNTEVGGSYLIPTVTMNEISRKIKSPGNILSAVRTVQTSTGSPLNWPMADDTANEGSFIAEGVPVVLGPNPVYGHVSLGEPAQWHSGEIISSKALVNDSQYDLLTELTEEIAIRAQRSWSDMIVNDSSNGLVNVAGTGSLVAASPTVVSYEEILSLQSKVDPGVAMIGSYFFSYATYLKIAALVSTTGAKLWSDGERNAGLLWGRPYCIVNALASPAHSVPYLGFGNLRSVILRLVNGMSVHVLREVYASNLQNAYIGQQRVNSTLLRPEEIAFLIGG
jgi:HK97 family phage major capsid protein